MRLLKVNSVVGVFLALAACITHVVHADVPARIIDPTPESRAELQRVVSGALGGRSVTLADDALTKNSLLVIEPKHLTGRDLRKPEHFRLVSVGSTCVLVHQRADTRYELKQARCTTDTDR